LLVAPSGLDSVVELLVGCPTAESQEALDFARRIVERLRDVVKEDSSARHLPVGLDGSLLGSPCFGVDASVPADIKSQVRVASALHATADLGGMTLHLADAQTPAPDEFVELLRYLWKRGDMRRLQLGRPPDTSIQLAFDR
jgi:hypothetical protein